MKLIVIGAVAGGTTAAVSTRRFDKMIDITVYERDHDISYVSCGMPYYIGGVVENANTLAPRGPEYFKEKHRIDIFTRHEVIGVDHENHKVIVKNLETEEVFSDTYDRLIFATGASVIKPPIKGADLPHVFHLRRFRDMLGIKEFIKEKQPHKAVIVGTGFIGLETAEALIHQGIEVSLVERMDRVSYHLDPDVSPFVQDYIEEKGIPLHLGSSVISIDESEVTLEDGTKLPADFVLLATGIRPNTTLAKSIGVELAENGAILVNERLETNIENVYATGDCSIPLHLISKIPVYRPLGSTANKTGRVVGEVIAGLPSTFPGIMGTSIYRFLELSIAQTGLSEEEANKAGFQVVTNMMSSEDRPLFMGGKEMQIKLIVEKASERLLGAQIVGFEGVDKRIDVLATAMTFGGTLDNLITMDLAYTPVFNTSSDPLAYAAMFFKTKLRMMKRE